MPRRPPTQRPKINRVATLFPVSNVLSIDGRTIRSHGRWAALLVSLLVNSESRDGARSLTLTRFSRAATILGQHGNFDRRAISNILAQAESMIDEALGLGYFASCLRHPPRGRTVGPYSWTDDPEISWTIDSDEFAALRVPPVHTNQHLLALSASIQSKVEHDTARVLLDADLSSREGDHVAALQELGRLDLGRLSVCGRCVVLLRMARANKYSGRFDEALDLLDEVARLLPNTRDATIRAEHAVLSLRCHYDQDPTANYGRVLQGSQWLDFGNSSNPRTMFEWMNLRASCFRRKLEGVVHARGEAEEQAEETIRTFHCALYWAIQSGDWSLIESVAANLGNCYRILYAKELWPSIEDALDWLTFSLSIIEKFNAGKDSAWEWIFLGRMYLTLPNARPYITRRFAAEKDHRYRPDKVGFYECAAERARAVGDPRQLAIALLMLNQFALLPPASEKISADAVHQLLDVLKITNGLGGQLLREGNIELLMIVPPKRQPTLLKDIR